MESVCVRGGGREPRLEACKRALPEVERGGSTRQAGGGRQDPAGTAGALQQWEGRTGVLQMLDQGHRHQRVPVRGRASQSPLPEHGAEDKAQ
eukprot:5247130-Amphidinium_carterae.1